ncbi:protocatechuate 3,4-dioxygenase [Thalassospira profundimaris]|uniref:Protocatechuate 3,4-dioxygenase n=1 Tax=Thalassospira profundimaris TaxID=502049 RepID=A0A367XI80_9PROT|nr:protocatechuate 3,4-dioxygenase subunit beta [Thalassospira profundimaris]RCK52412.1 protocatechuate 3,4-dioxygenase [Thalassospira profundimaris]
MSGFKPRDWSSHAPYIAPDYKSTILRGPTKPLMSLSGGISEASGPVFARAAVRDLDWDLTRNGRVNGEPIGERIVVHGKVMDGDGRPVPHTLIEVWQANAAGRYVHKVDQHDAPLDPNFRGSGRCMSDENGNYVFYTIKPGAYPWGNHFNAWRPNHIHLSLFGPGFATRLVTQMYFPGDPLLALDPIFLGTPDEAARNRLISKFSIDKTEEGFALGYQFDIVLRGRLATPMED